MAFNENLANRIRERLVEIQIPNVEEKAMMGGLTFMVNDKMCVGLDIDNTTGKDRLMVSVGKAGHDQLVFKKGSREMDFTGKVMRGFLFIDPEGFDTEEDLDFWIEKALYFNLEIS